MRQGPNGNEVHSLERIVADGIDRNTAGGLDLHMTSGSLFPLADHNDRFAGLLRREVIEHDTIGDIRCQRLVDLLKITYLDLDLEVLAFLFTIIACTRKGICNTAGNIDVIVFSEDHVE